MKKIIIAGAAVAIAALGAALWMLAAPSVIYQVNGTAVSDSASVNVEYESSMRVQDLADHVEVRAEYDGRDVSDTIVMDDVADEMVQLGTYTLTYHLTEDEHPLQVHVTVQDTQAPQLHMDTEYTTRTGETFDVSRLIVQVYDNYDVNVLDSLSMDAVDTSAAGLKESVVRITDSSGNEAECAITVDVRDDASAAEAGTQYFVQQDPDDITLILNASHRLAQGWEPDDLTQIDDSANSGHMLRKEAADAWNELYAAAQKEGITINVVSSFRTEEYQRTLFEGYLAVDPDAASYSAYPRTSEHELGLTVDISYDAQLHDDLQQSQLGIWMAENGWRYGWIVRYPEGKQELTGYIYEPWHYRYVGRTLAAQLHEQDLCLEEYYAQRTEAKND